MFYTAAGTTFKDIVPCWALIVQEEYQDPDQLWQKAKGQDGTHKDWYQGAVQYWDQQEASYDGVLGGFGYVSDYDISDSRALLQRVSNVGKRGGEEAVCC